jgi:putative FmdB family regulatory protein
MPIYEYRCTSCGHVTEVLQRSRSDKPLKKCPKCSGDVEKLISRSSFQLKGGGWYATGYARKGTGGETGKDKAQGSGESEGGKEGGKAEAASSQESSSGAVSESKPSKKTGSASKKKD